ncbi:F-box SKIP23-like protein (DUF295) [Rhynchospora pubera]|uniref:F-box SKIP23-like protein (DUF295) n=1 Tax=Rhynchospora pubera TaxID=906938 RepID=A0AAV8HXY9_9POAL|nr:F-box SKIP23-like protein (DUF295) [Rhynchospora pubera]
MAGIRSEPDWSGLAPELLQTIARKLPDISDFVKFRAVCATWRSSAPVSDPPPQLPWFLQQPFEDESDDHLSFYSLFSGKLHTISSRNSSGNELIGPAHDYIVLYDWTSHQISLLNPLTDTKVVLPFLDIAPPRLLLQVGPDPIHRGECVALTDNLSILALFKPAENEWVVIKEPSFLGRNAYYNGMYFIHDHFGVTKVVDTVNRKVLHVIPPSPESSIKEVYNSAWGEKYLVQSAGDILQVCLHDFELHPVTDCQFHICKLEGLSSENGGKPHWVKVSSIGDQILFLDDNNGFSLSCRDFSGFRGNSIYFIKWQANHVYDQPRSVLCRYDIEQARAEPLTCPLTKGGTWIVPSLR